MGGKTLEKTPDNQYVDIEVRQERFNKTAKMDLL